MEREQYLFLLTGRGKQDGSSVFWRNTVDHNITGRHGPGVGSN